MTENEDKWRAFEIQRKENMNIMKDASNNFDKVLLVLSAAAIGIIPQIAKTYDNSRFHCLFVTSLWFFLMSIVASLISFMFTQFYANKQMKYDIEFYIKHNEVYREKIPVFGYFAMGLQVLAGIVFVIAILLLMIVISVNI